MPIDQIYHPVKADDLILIYTNQKAHILRVRSVSNPDVAWPTPSSITVQEVYWHIPDERGYWSISGPVAYFVESGSKVSERCLCRLHERDSPEVTVREFLDSVQRDRTSGGQDDGYRYIVKPNGREVFMHYFKKRCPLCGKAGTLCSGCEICGYYPDASVKCGHDIACPVCLGYTATLADKETLEEIDELEGRLKECRSNRTNTVWESIEINELKEDLIMTRMDRVKVINEHKKAMAIPVNNVDQKLEEITKMYESDLEEDRIEDGPLELDNFYGTSLS